MSNYQEEWKKIQAQLMQRGQQSAAQSGQKTKASGMATAGANGATTAAATIGRNLISAPQPRNDFERWQQSYAMSQQPTIPNTAPDRRVLGAAQSGVYGALLGNAVQQQKSAGAYDTEIAPTTGQDKEKQERIKYLKNYIAELENQKATWMDTPEGQSQLANYQARGGDEMHSKAFHDAVKGDQDKFIDTINAEYDRMITQARKELEELDPKVKEAQWDFFQTPKAFKNGYDFGDITKTILGTTADVGMGLVKGAAQTVEGVLDLGVHAVGWGADALGFDETADFLHQQASMNQVAGSFASPDKFLDGYSALGKTMDAVTEGVGQVGVNIATGGIGKAAGWGSKASALLTYGIMGASSMGSGMSEAYSNPNGATDGEAFMYGLIAGAADIATEMIFGGIGKGVNMLGFNKGLSSADDMIAKKVASVFNNQLTKNLVEFGIKSSAEGLEEVLAGGLQALGKKMTYMSEKDLSDILADENLFEQFIVEALTSGISQSGGLNRANKTGTDFITGFNQNEQAVIQREVENRIAEEQKDGKKLTARQIAEIKARVEQDIEKGYISTDTIEEVLGGDGYKTYKDISAKLESLQSEYDELYQMKHSEKSDAQIDRQAELKKQIDGIKATFNGKQAQAQIRNQVYGLVKGGRLAESYYEGARRKQAYQADLSKYDKKQQAIIKAAVDSGVLNNTNRTHDFVDMIAKVSAEKGVSFSFTNNQKLKESGFALNGKTINGYVTKDGITLNVNSAKSLNKVVGHEIAHVLEGTEFYNEVRQAIYDYAQTKGEWKQRYDSIKALYKDVADADIKAELTADLIGDYLFTDPDFIKNLSVNHRNVFQKMYDEIKYLCSVATAGSKELRQLEKAKKAFAEAYRAETRNPTADGGARYSVTEGMTDAERYAELKDKKIKVAKVQENAILDSYDIEGKSLNDIYKFIKENKESLGLNKVYQKDEIQLEFGYSNRGIKKSIRQTADSKVDEREYLDILSCLNQIIDTSVLIERHGDKSGKQNTQLKQVYVLLGAFHKNGVTTPVQLEIKESVGTDNQLYIAVAIKKSGVNVTASTEAASVTNPDFSAISIHELIEKINPDAKDFLKYIPDGFLTPEQKEGKKEGIRRDIEKYPNSPFRHIDSGADERKVQQLAIILEANPMWDDYHTGIRSVDDIRTWEEVLELDDESEGQFVWGDFSREDAENALMNNSVTVYSSHPISNGTFVSTSYIQAWEYAGGNKNSKVYSKEVSLDEVAWINGDEGQYAKVESNQGVANDKPAADPDIRYSLSEDSRGREIPAETQERLQYSVIRDESGRIKPMYHGSPNGNITSFNAGTYFTENKEYADRYQNTGASSISTGKVAANPKTYEVYLDIRKPFDLNDAEARNIYINEYIKGGNAIGINPYLSDAEYAKIKSIDWTEGEDLRDFLIDNGYDYDGLVLDEGADGGYGDEVKYRGTSYMIFDAKQVVNVEDPGNRFYLPESVEGYKFSLSNVGETQKSTGKYNVYGKDIALPSALEDISPLPQNIPIVKDAPGTISEPETVAEGMFPDVLPTVEQEIDSLSMQIDDLVAQITEKAEAGQYDSEFERICRECEALQNQKEALEQEVRSDAADRLSSLDDTDAPPDIGPVFDEQTEVIPITKKLEDDIARNVRNSLALDNKDMADVHRIIRGYVNGEIIGRNQLFGELKKYNSYTESEHREDVAEAKAWLRDQPVKVDDTIKWGIADYNILRRQNFGKIRFSNDGAGVDVVYRELSEMWPQLFPESIYVPGDQFEQMIKVANMDSTHVVDMEIPDKAIMDVVDGIIRDVGKYRQTQKEKAANKYGRESFESLMADADKHIPQFSPEAYRRLSERPNVVEPGIDDAPLPETYTSNDGKSVKGQQELALDDKRLTEQEARLEKIVKRIDRKLVFDKSEINRDYRLEKSNLNKSDPDYARKLAELDRKYNAEINKLEVVAEMKRRNAETAVQRQSKSEEYVGMMEGLAGDTSTWVDKKLGISYKTNTLRRNLRDVVRDANGNRDIARADAIYEELQGKYNKHEAMLNVESAKIKQPYADMKISSAEDAYIQMLGELRHNPETTLSEEVVKDFYNKHKKKIDEAKVEKAIEEARKTYDSLLVRVNEVLREQGMKEIPYRKGYFPHFTDPKQNWLAKLLNWKTKDFDIPTDIAGLTENFNPNRSWQSFNKQRQSDDTDYSFLKGMDSYVQGALDWIYHIEDIQKNRAFENYLRYIHSEQGVKDKIDAINASEDYDADEAQRQIELVYAEAGNPLNNLVTNLRSRTNSLAGKKNSGDRGMEENTNRKVYSTMTNLSNRLSANMVGGSISSALTNFIPITQSWLEVSPVNSLKAMGDTIKATVRDDGMIEKSAFLTNRLRQADSLYKSGWDKVEDKATVLFDGIDSFTSQTVWRSKYLQNISEGMSENAAIEDADQFAENVIAGRSRGNMPTVFNAKNPVAKLFTAFQLEVNNQYQYMLKDAPQDSKSKARLVKGYAAMFFGAYAYNALFSTLTGRNAAFDPVRIIEELLRDMGVLGDNEEEETSDILVNFADNILEEVPFVGGFMGGGRVPINSALPFDGNIPDMVESIGNMAEGDFSDLTNEWMNPVYYLVMPMAGGQLRKTIQGLSMFSDDHPIAGSYTDKGDLRFPVEDTTWNRIQAGLFGQYASDNARDYFDQGRKPLNEKQIQEFIDVDLPIQAYWDYRDGLKGLSSVSEQADYINSLDIPIWKKNLLINNLTDRKEPIDMTDYGMYGSFEEFDFAQKNPEKYSFFRNNGISYSDYAAADEDMKRTYTWAYENPEKFTLSQAVTSDLLAYRKYTDDLSDIRADYDRNGKAISGTAKAKKKDYIFSLPGLDDGQKAILYRSLYDSAADKAQYNWYIVDYLNNREDITYTEMITILKELGFTIGADGVTVSW